MYLTRPEGTSFIGFKECPYCKKEFELEIKEGALTLDIRKEEESALPAVILEEREMWKKLKEKGLHKYIFSMRSAITKLGEKRKTIKYSEIKSIAEKQGVKDESDLKMILKLLMREGDIVEPKIGSYKVV